MLLRIVAACLAAVCLLNAGAAGAQDYPSKPVKVIIPFPPAGSNDVVGRIVATALGQRLGQQMVIENRGGAGGVIGTDLAAKAAPDGYTIVVISIAHAVNPWLYKLQYDPIKAFEPIGMIGSGPNVVAVHPDFPVKSIQDLIKLAKEKPGDLQYASAGSGSFQHLGGELFKQMAGVDIQHVPYKGGGPAMLDVIGGHMKLMFSSLVQTTPHIKSGKLRAIAVGGLKRSPVLPDVPTVAESGVPGYEGVNWWGLAAPAGTPKAIIDKLHAELNLALDSKEVQAAFDKEGAEVIKKPPAEFGAYMAQELAKWEKVVKTAGIKAE
jgi:tripartite-type tricarboxylate transporter receptor subunit TctC